MKKSQMYGQIFIYILTIIIIGLIAIYGYRAIMGFSKRAEQITFLKFKTDLETSIDMIRTDYGSVKKAELDVPGKYREICFVDLDDANRGGISISEDYPIMKNSVEGGVKKNVFLIVDIAKDSFYVGKIYVLDSAGELVDYHCYPVVNSKIKLRLEGFGDKTLISEWGVQPSQSAIPSAPD